MARKMRRSFTFRYLVYFLFPLVVAGCDFSSLDDPIVISNVEDEFNIDLWETVAPTRGERNLVVQIESTKTEDCLNYRIDYQYIKDGSRLKIALSSLVKPLDCVPGTATVKTNVSTGALLNGIYKLNIDLKNTIVNEGQLNVRNDSYTIEMQSENGFSLTRKELLRVPDGALWGYVQFENTSDAALANQFLEELNKLGQSTSAYRPGYYGHFTIASLTREVTVFEQPAVSNNLKTFLLDYTGANNTLKDLVQQHRQHFGGKGVIKLLNAKGESF